MKTTITVELYGQTYRLTDAVFAAEMISSYGHDTVAVKTEAGDWICVPVNAIAGIAAEAAANGVTNVSVRAV